MFEQASKSKQPRIIYVVCVCVVYCVLEYGVERHGSNSSNARHTEMKKKNINYMFLTTSFIQITLHFNAGECVCVFFVACKSYMEEAFVSSVLYFFLAFLLSFIPTFIHVYYTCLLRNVLPVQLCTFTFQMMMCYVLLLCVQRVSVSVFFVILKCGLMLKCWLSTFIVYVFLIRRRSVGMSSSERVCICRVHVYLHFFWKRTIYFRKTFNSGL